MHLPLKGGRGPAVDPFAAGISRRHDPSLKRPQCTAATAAIAPQRATCQVVAVHSVYRVARKRPCQQGSLPCTADTLPDRTSCCGLSDAHVCSDNMRTFDPRRSQPGQGLRPTHSPHVLLCEPVDHTGALAQCSNHRWSPFPPPPPPPLSRTGGKMKRG